MNESQPNKDIPGNQFINPIPDTGNIDVDAWSTQWWSGLARASLDSEEYHQAAGHIAAQTGMHPAIRPIDNEDLAFVMELLRLIGHDNPHDPRSRSSIEQHMHGRWEQFKQLGQLMGRQLVRRTLDDVESYIAFRQERERAGTDYLTGVMNRRGLVRSLRKQYDITDGESRGDQDVESSEPIELTHFYVDANRFKWINDTLGHHVGDAAIVEISRELQGLFRQAEAPIIYRHGGDEFGVVIRGLEGREVEAIVDRIIVQQVERLTSATYYEGMRSITERIRAVKESGARPRIEVKQERLIDGEPARRPDHMIYINGTEVTDLRSIVTLAIGAHTGIVSNLHDVEALRIASEQNAAGVKQRLHEIIDRMSPPF